MENTLKVKKFWVFSGWFKEKALNPNFSGYFQGILMKGISGCFALKVIISGYFQGTFKVF